MSWMNECQTPAASHALAELQPLAEQHVALAPCHPASPTQTEQHEMCTRVLCDTKPCCIPNLAAGVYVALCLLYVAVNMLCTGCTTSMRAKSGPSIGSGSKGLCFELPTHNVQC